MTNKKRQIKFRVWDKHTKKMWQWEDHNAFDTEKGSIKRWFEDKDFIVMQFTGAKDQNGKEIYEGDILEIDKENWAFEEHCPSRNIVIVKWNDEDCALDAWVQEDDEYYAEWHGNIMSQNFSELKIIGNIYQNKKI